MNLDSSWTLVGVCIAAGLGFVAGLIRPWWHRAPVVASKAIGVGYLCLLAGSAGWWASCPGCTSLNSYEYGRVFDFFIALYWGALFAAGVFMVIWVSAGASSFVSRRLGYGANRQFLSEGSHDA